MVNEALGAAERLAAEGISCEIVDPRTLQPLDTDTIVNSAKKTNRVVVVHEAVRFGGLGAEIAAQIQELAFDYLDAPVARIGAPFSPVPFTPALEQHFVPNSAIIESQIRDVLHRNVGAL
jgi:pyruvate dehydrogenase E1 component beta subunit